MSGLLRALDLGLSLDNHLSAVAEKGGGIADPAQLQGRRHSIRLLAEQLFQQARFEPVIAFESNDVLLLDSMMHQAVGVGLVSKAHVTP